ncbi:MAG: aminotransferase class V-fold PLP-dependent enzyme [Candidatus Caenarcaniphilales bacterium]|nr:aminotransferase class V-fold PLP-dependent enzyme [Candidatus Caenarcaniphilales bacterium]
MSGDDWLEDLQDYQGSPQTRSNLLIPGISYFNWAGLAPLRWQAWMMSLFAHELAGNIWLPKLADLSQRLKNKVAKWIGCTPNQIAFVPSTSLALHQVALAIPWTRGDRIIYPLHDFPANIIPWQKLEREGVTAQGVDYFKPVFPSDTKLMTISTVDFSTGSEQPWREMVNEAHRLGIWTCVDAIQSAGIKSSWIPEIDFWCSGVQKWLVSGLGLAILIVSERALKELTPRLISWLALYDPPRLESGIVQDCLAWEMGWVSPQALVRLHTNLDFFERYGWEVISQEVKRRRDKIHEGLLEMGWEVVSSAVNWSGIISLKPPDHLSVKEIVQDGYQHKIITAERGKYLRLAVHIFNSEREIAKILRWLRQWRSK